MNRFTPITWAEARDFRAAEIDSAEATQRRIEAGILMATLALARTTAAAVEQLAARAGHEDVRATITAALKRNDRDLIDAATPPETGDESP
jgi:hypothetical protein